MSLDRFYSLSRRYIIAPEATQQTQFREITKCFVRKDHLCGKFLGASKSCFVACPSTEEVGYIIEIIKEKLTKIGIEYIIAIEDRAWGQDIFCTKICGKIIESLFCIVILDDTIENISDVNTSIPNPNVYYEYGLMTSLGKHIIPLQKDGQDLAFNIQTHDTIKYTSSQNLSTELDRAFKDAAKITAEDRTKEQRADALSERLFIRSLEINGYQRKDYEWFLNEDINDTVFRGLSHNTRREYVFCTITNTKESLQNALTDAQVIIKRLETRCEEMTKEIGTLSAKMDKLTKDLEKAGQPVQLEKGIRVISSQSPILKRSLDDTTSERDSLSSKLELIQNSKFIILITPEVIELKEKAIKQYKNIEQRLSLPLYIGDISGVQIGDKFIAFMPPTL
jgi:hypothetical protein